MGNTLIQKNYQLPQKLSPFNDEGPNGYLMRLADANLLTIKDLKNIGIGYNLEQLKSFGLLDQEIVDNKLKQNLAQINSWRESGKTILNEKHARCCPKCLDEIGYWRLEWEILFNDVCHHHQIWLIDECGSCHKKLNWQRRELLRCECGADIRQEKCNLSSAPKSMIELSRVLSQKLGSSSEQVNSMLPLAKTNIEQSQRLIRYLGNYMNQVTGKNPLKMIDAGDLNNSWNVTSLAAEMLNKWPESFHESLTKLEKTNHKKKDRPSLNEVFGQAYLYIFDHLQEPAFNEVKNQFEFWIAKSWRSGLAGRNKRLLPEILKNATWIPSIAACDYLGVSIQRLKMLIREGAIEGETYISAKGREFIMVRRDGLPETKAKLFGMINMVSAQELLGIHKRRMRQLLRFLFKDARKLGTSRAAPWEVSRIELNKILDVSNELLTVSIPDEDCVSLGHIMKYWTFTNQEIANLIFAVVKKDINPVNNLDTERGISAWVFRKTEIQLWKLKLEGGLTNWMTIDKASKVLGVKQQVAYQLVKISLLKAEVMPEQRKQGTRVSKRSIEEFKQNYIFSTQIAEKLGCSSKKVIKDLAFMGVKPVSGPSVDGMRQMLYKRDQVLCKLEIPAFNNNSN